MKTIIKGRWLILAIWIITTITLTVLSPDINSIMRDREQKILPDGSPSVVADEIYSKMSDFEGSSDIIVFYDKDKISDSSMSKIETSVRGIVASSDELGIGEVMDPFTTPDAASSLISEDGTTLMVSLKLDKQGRTISEIKKQFDSKLADVDTTYYLSGKDFINEDYQAQAEAGVSKSAALTVIFILVVLMLMFRSIITPIVSLLSVVFAYLCSMGIAAQLIDKANFPVTSLTQILMILILFGIGTDYNILLFNRFKEELSHGLSIDDAIIQTYKTAGKTIAFSILTVLIAFLSLAFAQSSIYQSGIVVVIGAAVLLLEIVTLTPFAMKLLGNKVFWPSKTTKGHKDSKAWGGVSSFATKHPLVSVIGVLIIILPTIFLYEKKLSFNTVGELGDSTASSEGFNLVAKHFGEGQAMPSFVMIESDETLDNNQALAVIDSLTEKIKKIDGVSKVSSITQPEGTKINEFYIGNQMASVTEGLTTITDSIGQINQSLSLGPGATQLAALTGGLNQIQDGLGQTNDYLATLTTSDAFYMPEQALKDQAFQPAMDNFFSTDRKVTMINVVLADDPYSEAAIKTVNKIQNIVSDGLNGSVLSDAKYGVSGQTSYTGDMNKMLSSDLSRTSVVVLIGVLIVLILVTRSFWAPIFITGSLMGAFYASQFVINRIFIDMKGYDGISSYIPFFSFIIIVALGVDYSIFVMARFKEYSYLPAKQAIVLACKQIGGVVMSAVVILGGTFATLMPSGLLLLIELAVAVITGLIVLCLIMLPVFLPAMISLQEKVTELNEKANAKNAANMKNILAEE